MCGSTNPCAVLCECHMAFNRAILDLLLGSICEKKRQKGKERKE